MTEPTIICPKRKMEIKLTESPAAVLKEIMQKGLPRDAVVSRVAGARRFLTSAANGLRQILILEI